MPNFGTLPVHHISSPLCFVFKMLSIFLFLFLTIFFFFLHCPCRVPGHFWVIWCSCLKMACNSKTDGRRVKQSEIYDSCMGSSNTYGSPKIHRYSSYMAVRPKPNLFLSGKWPCRASNWPLGLLFQLWQLCSSKMAGRRAKRTQIWALGVLT